MLKRLLAAIGLGAATVAVGAPPYAPYGDASVNAIYNLLFCDDLIAFQATAGGAPAQWQAVLTADPPDLSALRSLAEDPNGEGRIRALAYRRLRDAGQEVPKGVLLGVITEVALPEGLDTLAAFSEGGVRYINRTGKMLFIEGAIKPTQNVLPRLFAASQSAVNRLKPANSPRWPPPALGRVRFTFLTSEGLYFGEGPRSAMENDPTGGPILKESTELLLEVVKLGTAKGA